VSSRSSGGHGSFHSIHTERGTLHRTCLQSMLIVLLRDLSILGRKIAGAAAPTELVTAVVQRGLNPKAEKIGFNSQIVLHLVKEDSM